MSIFRRNKAEAAEPDPATEELQSAADQAAGDPDAAGEGTGSAEESVADRGAGPYDESEVDGPQGRLDLGSLWVVGVPGMELRLEVEEASQTVVGATAVLGDSAVQLQAFAAPRTLGVWDDIRAEIAESIVGQGGTADEQRGVLGTELRTRMPSAGPDGRTVFAPARFVGVDGPRWFLRAVLSGRAAIDDDAAAPLLDIIRGTVVVRGETAMAPRELLPLRLPQSGPAEPAAEAEAAGPGRSAGDLNPFERGPEITEVR